MKQVELLVLFGGESSEHEVSIASARNVVDAIDKTKYKINLAYIDESGKWYLVDTIDGYIDYADMSQLMPVLGSKTFVTLGSSLTINPGVILPILHGTNGEDGSVQAIAQLVHVPIVGCGLASSAVCMDKVFTKQILEQNGIKTVPYAIHLSSEPTDIFEELTQKLGNTLFIKPANGGSSVGIAKVQSNVELEAALLAAHKFDDKVLIERAIQARELEVAVLGNGLDARASGVGEIIPDRDFYDYESKYDSNSQTRVDIPAKISDELSTRVTDITVKVYRALDCRGMARVDFFLDEGDELYVNEVNTLPGFTDISMYPKLWQAKGMSYGELIDELISSALDSSKG